MKKMKWMILGAIFILAGAACFVYISKHEREKQYPIERYQENQQAQEDKEDSVAQNTDGEIMEDTEDSHSFTQGNITYTFLALDVIPDTEIETQTRYPGEFFLPGELPDATYEAITYDYEKMIQEAPALKDIFSAKLDYTVEEYSKIFDENLDAYNKGVDTGHPKTDYYFVRIQIRNDSPDKMREIYLSALKIVVTNTNKKTYAYRDGFCYFSNPQYTEEEDRVHSFSKYNLQPGEILECTVGFEVRRDMIYPSDQLVYLGLISQSMDEAWVNPIEYKNVIMLDDLPRMEE